MESPWLLRVSWNSPVKPCESWYYLARSFSTTFSVLPSMNPVLLQCYVSVVFFSCCVQFFVTLWTAACQASLSFTISQGLLKLMSTELVMPPTIPSSVTTFLPSIFPSITVFSNELALHIRMSKVLELQLQHQWPKYWSFSFTISPSSEYSELISFRIDWLDLAGQGTLRGVLHHHSSKASILQRSALFMVQLSHPYMNTGKTIALTI